MLKLFKALGIGFAVVITSPLWLLILALIIVFLIFKYIIGEILTIVYFFRGYNYSNEDEYDVALEEAIAKEEEIEKRKQEEESKPQKPIYVQTIPDKYIDPRFFQDNLDEESDEDE